MNKNCDQIAVLDSLWLISNCAARQPDLTGLLPAETGSGGHNYPGGHFGYCSCVNGAQSVPAVLGAALSS